MADQLYLSYRLRGYTEGNMTRHFEKMLRTFPFSRLSQAGITIRVNAVSFNEPPVYEQACEGHNALDAALEAAREFQHADGASTIEAAWDLWQFDDKEWKLAPARVALICLGPTFESDLDDHLRIDFGIDTYFLPQPAAPEGALMIQSNVRSLLQLVRELDNVLAAEERRLWTESGENFADRLLASVQGEKPGPRLV